MDKKRFDFKLPGFKWTGIFFALTILGVAGDLWSKSAAFDFVLNNGNSYFEYPIIDGFFNLVYRENPGAAWSIFAGKKVFLSSISVIALLAISFGFFTGIFKTTLTKIAAALFTAGVIGNLYDRLFNDGKVRDFLDFYYRDYHYPAFNLADSMLCIAVGLILIQTLREGKKNK
jgi:signal peptidase II